MNNASTIGTQPSGLYREVVLKAGFTVHDTVIYPTSNWIPSKYTFSILRFGRCSGDFVFLSLSF